MDRWSQGGALSSSLPPPGTEESSSYSSGEDDFSPSGVSAERRERGHSPRREGRRRTTMTARRDFSSPELLGRWRSAHNLPRLLPDRRRHHRSLDHAASSPLLGPSRAPSVLRSALKTTALLFLPVALFFAYLEWRDPTGGGLPGSGGASWAGAGKGGGGRASSVIMAGGKYQLAVLDFGGGAFENGGGVRSAKPPLPTAEMRWSPRVRRRGGEEEAEEGPDALGSRLQQRQMVPLDVSTAPRRDEETSQTAMAAPPPFPRGVNVQPASHARNRVKAASAAARKKGGGKNAGWIPSAFPNPRDDPGRCGLVAGGVVVPSGGTGGGGAGEIPAAYGGMTYGGTTTASDGGGGAENDGGGGGGSAANDEHNSAENSREEEVAPRSQDEQAAAANGEEGSDGDDDDNDESDVSPEDDHRGRRRRRSLQPAVAENPSAEEETPLLCDPDEVLGYVYMNQVADALRKFREKYGPRRRPIPLGHPNSASKTESGGCSDVDATSAEPKEKNTDEGTEWEVEALPPSPPGTVLGTEPGVPLPAIEWEVDDEGSDAGGGAGGGGGFEIAVAVARRMDLPSVLRVADSYYSYEDEDDLVNDAAQYFARYLHDAWWAVADDNDDDGNGAPSEAKGGSSVGNADDGGTGCGQNGTAATTTTLHPTNRSPPVDGVLLFLSVQDRVCFVSTGPTSSSSDSSGSSSRSVLPWWRLERVVSSMRPSLRRSEYGPAVLGAISDISALLDAGPPDLAERSRDFVERFGVVIVFAAFTFAMAAWGEYRDRNRRYQYAEARSKMTPKEEEAANALRERFGERSCPICLEEFPPPFEELNKDEDDSENKEEKDEVEEKRAPSPTDASPSASTSPSSRSTNPRGSDGKPLKLLRCGHVFDRTCWRHWVDSGQGDPCLCPVCRRDVGGKDARDKSKYAGPAGETSAAAAEPSVQLDRGARGQHQQGQRNRRRRRRRRNREARIADMASGAAAAERGDGDRAAEETTSAAAAATATTQASTGDAAATASAPRRRRGYDTLPQASAADSEGPDQRIQSGLLVSFLSRRWPRVQPRWRRRRGESDSSPRLTSAATEETALLGDEESPAAAGSL